MGNCLLGGMGEPGEAAAACVRVITATGGIMELEPPITAACITSEFPGHAIFPSHDLFWKPLPNDEELTAGESYYLLPLKLDDEIDGSIPTSSQIVVREGHIRSNSSTSKSITSTPLVTTTYRMSFDYKFLSSSGGVGGRRRHKYRTRNNSKYGNGSGIWKVKLAISREQLGEILSEEGRTKELMESVRTVAKCGNEQLSSSSSSSSSHLALFSDQWSLYSSRSSCINNSSSASSSKNDYLLLDI